MPTHGLTAQEFISYVASHRATEMHDGWQHDIDPVLLTAVYPDRLRRMAEQWITEHGCAERQSAAEWILASLISMGPSAWQQGVL